MTLSGRHRPVGAECAAHLSEHGRTPGRLYATERIELASKGASPDAPDPVLRDGRADGRAEKCDAIYLFTNGYLGGGDYGTWKLDLDLLTVAIRESERGCLSGSPLSSARCPWSCNVWPWPAAAGCSRAFPRSRLGNGDSSPVGPSRPRRKIDFAFINATLGPRRCTPPDLPPIYLAFAFGGPSFAASAADPRGAGLAIGTYGLQSMKLDDAIRLIAGTGFNALEVSAMSGTTGAPSVLASEDRKRLRALIADSGLRLCGIMRSPAERRTKPITRRNWSRSTISSSWGTTSRPTVRPWSRPSSGGRTGPSPGSCFATGFRTGSRWRRTNADCFRSSPTASMR